jgi:hypothetical protein
MMRLAIRAGQARARATGYRAPGPRALTRLREHMAWRQAQNQRMTHWHEDLVVEVASDQDEVRYAQALE